MKTIRLPFAISLEIFALALVAGALTWVPGSVVRADEAMAAPAAPPRLPRPRHSDDDVADVPFGVAPVVDGYIAPREYAGAGRVTFPGYAGDVNVFFRHDAVALYVAFDSPDTTPHPLVALGARGPAFQVFLDTANDKAVAPLRDDYRLTVDKGGGLRENRGNGSGWRGDAVSRWNAAVYTASWGWQAEFAIALSKLGVSPGTPTSVGLGLAEVWTPSWPHDWYWPASGYYLVPDTWGTVGSSNDWSTFYWKPGHWHDYAPSGMPDFDQMQMSPVYAGPFAVANLLWWFDSKFEPIPEGLPLVGPPGTIPISDSYPLVESYSSLAWDDHDPRNVLPLAVDLSTYFRTGLGMPGTHIYDMYYGIQDYLRDHGLRDEYVVTLVEQPDFFWIAEEVMRGEDLVLLLGWWEEQPPGSGHWVRIAGHFVTVAGVDPVNALLALSDPAQDAAEGWGLPGPSRVPRGTLNQHDLLHPSFPPFPTTHNDAGNVSHDVYFVAPGSSSPEGNWWIPDYPVRPICYAMQGANPNPQWEEPPGMYAGGMIHTEIEYALVVSSFTSKASGRWVKQGGHGAVTVARRLL